MFSSLLNWFQRHPAPAIIWTLLILIACSWPGSNLPPSPVVGFDKVIHIALFLGWSTLWLLIYPRKTVQVLLTGIAYGILIEFYQEVMPINRSFDWWDVLADGLGTILGVAVTLLALKYTQPD